MPRRCAGRRNTQQQVTVRQRLVVDRQGRFVVTEPLKGPHDPASQPVVAAMLIQDGCSTLTAKDLHRCDICPADASSLEMARISGFSASRPTTWQAGLLTEVIGIDLGLVHVAAPTPGVPGTMRRQCVRTVRPGRASAGCHGLTSLAASLIV